MNVAVVGSSGYLAKFIIERFERDKNIKKTVRIDQTPDADCILELQDASNFNYEILDNIDFIVFTAAISGPDKCASDFDFCWSVNVTNTQYFIRKAIERKCRVLFFSSDAVFGDIQGAIYSEKSETKAETPYGRMKKTVEDTFKNNPFFKTVRLSYVVSAEDRFVSYCLDCVKNGQTANVFHPFYRSCIAVTDVVNVVAWFLDHWNEYAPWVLNVAGKELVSRVRIADEINRVIGNRLKYTISTPGKDFYKNRPPVTQMRSLYLDHYRILEDTTFTEKIQGELESLLLQNADI